MTRAGTTGPLRLSSRTGRIGRVISPARLSSRTNCVGGRPFDTSDVLRLLTAVSARDSGRAMDVIVALAEDQEGG